MNSYNDLNIKIEKNIKHNFLYIYDYNLDSASYEKKILDNETIEKIIVQENIIEDGRNVLKYNIDNRIALKEYLCHNKLKFNDFVNIIKQIDVVYMNLENYLIAEKSLVLKPELIFLSCDKLCADIKFIVLPNYDVDIQYEVSKLLILLLRAVDIEDAYALDVAYNLFIISQKENYSFYDLLCCIKEYEQKRNPQSQILTDEVIDEYKNEILLDEKKDRSNIEYNIEDAYEDERITLSKNVDKNISIDNTFDENTDNTNRNINEYAEKYMREENSIDLADLLNEEDNNKKTKKTDKKKLKKGNIKFQSSIKQIVAIAFFGLIFPICLVVILAINI